MEICWVDLSTLSEFEAVEAMGTRYAGLCWIDFRAEVFVELGFARLGVIGCGRFIAQN